MGIVKKCELQWIYSCLLTAHHAALSSALSPGLHGGGTGQSLFFLSLHCLWNENSGMLESTFPFWYFMHPRLCQYTTMSLLQDLNNKHKKPPKQRWGGYRKSFLCPLCLGWGNLRTFIHTDTHADTQTHTQTHGHTHRHIILSTLIDFTAISGHLYFRSFICLKGLSG